MKKGLFIAINTWLSFLVVVIMLMVSTPVRVSAAGNAKLVLLPASQTVGLSNSFDVTIQVQANGNQIVALQTFLDYDPAKLKLNSITQAANWNGKSYNMLSSTVVSDYVPGQLEFSAGIIGGNITGNFTIATINFMALAATTNTSITFHFQPDTFRRDTEIADVNNSMVLYAATGASITIVSAGVANSQLVSIALTPLDQSIAAGQTQRFTAIGTYSNNISADITGSVTWTSSNTAVATIQNRDTAAPGTATGLAAGTTTITAASGSISNFTNLVVTKSEVNPTTAPPLPSPTSTVLPTTPPESILPGSTLPSPGVTPDPSATTVKAPTSVPAKTTPVSTTEPIVPQSPPPASSSTARLNWGLTGGIVGGVVVLGIVAYLLIRRRSGI